MQWKQWLETLKIDSIRRREFDLGEEPPLLIEDFAEDLAVEFRLQEPDGEGEGDNTNESSDSE